jgi:hypothetical protein
LPDPGVGEDHVDFSPISIDRFVQAIEVSQAGDVARDARRLLADFSNGHAQFVLATAGNEHVIHAF